MSIIPFILKDDKNNNYTIVAKGNKRESSTDEEKHLIIREMDTNYFQPIDGTYECNISYDLHIGDQYRKQNKRGAPIIFDKKRNSFIIRPNQAVIVQTKEQVNFPDSLFGLVLPKVSLLQYGISNTCSKIDPGYSGKLLITLFNLGKRTIKLKSGDPICSLVLININENYESEIKSYVKGEKALKNTNNSFEETRSIIEILYDWLCNNTGILAIFISLITLLLRISDYFLK